MPPLLRSLSLNLLPSLQPNLWQKSPWKSLLQLSLQLNPWQQNLSLNLRRNLSLSLLRLNL